MSNEELLRKLDKMDLPIQRRNHLNKRNLEWLSKNLSVKNKGHKHFEEVQKEVDRRLEEKEFYS